MEFNNLGLNADIVKALDALGFISPTPIQSKVIPEIIDSKTDLVGLAQTGTGKTAAFGLPMLQNMDTSNNAIQGLVICPTRELCLQLLTEIESYGRYIDGLKCVAVYGGASIVNQIRQIKKGVQVVVATPGRLLDLMNRKVIRLKNLDYLVLDEADEMLTMGFQDELDQILKKTPESKCTWLFSATMPGGVSRLTKTYLNDPFEITVGKKNAGAENIRHLNYVIREKDRYPALKRIIDYYPDIYGLIFCRTRKETQDVAEALIRDGYDAESLHGDLSQSQRDKVMARFREKNIQILVATDVAARGLDVKEISHVIHYKLPDDMEGYTHRSGRTARAGSSGYSIILMNVKEKNKLAQIKRKTGITVDYQKVPDGSDICEKQLYALINRMGTVDVNHDAIGDYLPKIYEAFNELSKEEVIQRFISVEFNRFLEYYKGAGDLNIPERSKANKNSKNDKKQSDFRNKTYQDKKSDKQKNSKSTNKRSGFRVQPVNTTRLFINVGRLDNIGKGAITRLVCDRTGLPSNSIGKIEVLREFSFFEVDTETTPRILKAMKKATLDGRPVFVQQAQRKASKKSGKKSKFLNR